MQNPFEFRMGSSVSLSTFNNTTGYTGPANLGTNPTHPTLLSILTEINLKKQKLYFGKITYYLLGN